jgi:hypothetical protein
MKVGDTVVLVGLMKATHLNGKVARITRKDEGDRWLVNLLDDSENAVTAEIVIPTTTKY